MNEAEIIVDEKVPTVTIIREFDAPVEKVFRAHVDPDLFVQWNWPDGYEVRFDHFDCRTGGAYRIWMSGEDMEGSVHGSFHDVGVPFLYFGVEDHDDMHQPTDTAERIDQPFFTNAAEMVLSTLLLLRCVGESSSRPTAQQLHLGQRTSGVIVCSIAPKTLRPS